jgi:hypothetical protein
MPLKVNSVDLCLSDINLKTAGTAALNERSIPTPSGTGRWQATSVNRVLQRARVER